MNWSARKFVSTAVATLCLLGMAIAPLAAQESVCARVKIEIKQELTLERQAFDAEMRITNSLPATPLTEVNVEVKVTDEMGVPVAITTDPNDLTAKFFLRQTQTQNIDNVSGTGQVAAQATAVINWLLVPAPGAAGNTPFGKRYLIGATLRYKFGSETHVMELNPDAITVKPLPSLTLDYFLTRDIIADDPFTTEIEAPEPYTLGVRVLNSGMAAAQQLKINSAQPRIVANQQGLPISFAILGGYVQDVPATTSLLIDFGDIPPSSAKMGRWQMESNLAGTFVDFSATFTHSDELGGALTSLLQATNAHLLVRDVRVDLPGRDVVRDFLAVEGAVYRLYESEGQDNDVTDRSAEAVLTTASGAYQLNLPPSQGFFYVRKPDPFQGQKALGPVLRADAKAMAVENVWLSKTKNPNTQQWEHWFNVFDVNSPGSYNVAFKDLDQVPRPPAVQFIPDRVVKENEQISFLVEASSPMGKPVVLSAAPLPTGATFHDQGDGVGVFDWTPEVGQAGSYLVNYLASDGSLSSTRSAKIRVESETPPVAPATPQLVAPLSGAEVPSLNPQFQVLTGEASNDPTVSVEFELYADAGRTVKLDEAVVAENPTSGQPTVWSRTEDLNDNTRYYWRARAVASNGTGSDWVDGNFFVNLFNNPPDQFNLTSPAPGIEVGSLNPTLSLTNANDRDDDAVTYSFEVFTDATLSTRYDAAVDVPADPSGSTSWTVTVPLLNHATYYWRAIAVDEHGAQTITPLRPFTVNTGNVAPTVTANPHYITSDGVALYGEMWDDDGDEPLTMWFELDTVDTFDSENRQTSEPMIGTGEQEWIVAGGLVDNQQYYWRVKAGDGRAESAWASSSFLYIGINDAPSVPVIKRPSQNGYVYTNATFEVYPSTDPENDQIQYVYEIYQGDEQQNELIAQGVSDSAVWEESVGCCTQNYYFMRVRAKDSKGAMSDWSPMRSFRSSDEGDMVGQASFITSGSLAEASGGSHLITWTSSDEKGRNVALHYEPIASKGNRTRIADGLHSNTNTGVGTHALSLSGLAPGAYRISGDIYDAKGMARFGSPEILVVPSRPQKGGINAAAIGNLRLREDRDTGNLRISLTRQPTDTVVLPLATNDATEAYVVPNQLVFTRDNWSLPQLAKVIAVGDGVRDDDQSIEITVGKAASLDPDYIGLVASTIKGDVIDQDRDASAGLSVANYHLASKERDSASGVWTYRYQVVLTNNGPSVKGGTAEIASAPGFKVVEGLVRFGAIDSDASVISKKEIVLTSTTDISAVVPKIVWKFRSK